MRTWMLGAALAAMVGCHGKFKREVGSIADVKLQVVTAAGPSATLGKVGYFGDPTPESRKEAAADAVGVAAATVFNVVQAVKEAEIRERIARAVDIGVTNSAMLTGVASTLGSGPPFEVVGMNESANVLQFEVLDWGLQVPAVGVQGSFTYRIRARLYKEGGDRVYSSRMTCDIAAGSPGATAQALLLVNNARQIKQMSDEELQAAFDAMAEYCGSVFVARLRRHAG